jgi:predicted CoA-binding protein
MGTPSDDVLRQILVDARTIAMVGASSDPARPSNGVMRRMLAAGYRVIPVNPNEREVLGQLSVSSLTDIREPVDIVNVFRRSEFVVPVAEDAVRVGAKVLWLQIGVDNPEAARIAERAGLTVVEDMCIAVVHSVERIPHK